MGSRNVTDSRLSAPRCAQGEGRHGTCGVANALAIVVVCASLSVACSSTKDPGRELFLRIVQQDKDAWRTSGPPGEFDFLQPGVQVSRWEKRSAGAEAVQAAFSALRVNRESRRVQSVSEVSPYVRSIESAEQAREYADLLRSLGVSGTEVPEIAWDDTGFIASTLSTRDLGIGYELVRRVQTPGGDTLTLVERVGRRGEYAFEWQ